MRSAPIPKSLQQPIPFGGQLVLAMAAAALAPAILLIAVGYAFFYDDPSPGISFQYWALLVVIWVLGTAFLIARLLAGGLAKQLDALASAASGTGSREKPAPGTVVHGNDFAELEEKFNQIEAVVAEGRAASLGKINELEAEVERLREAAELQAQFLSAISHEIRTPLSAIVSSARIIQRYHAEDRGVIDRFGGTIIAEGNRLVRTISDMLDLVKIESSRLEWRDDEVRPATVVKKAAAAIMPVATQHGLTVHVDAPEAMPTLWGDGERIRQTLDNLLRNAVKFTATGGRIEVRVCEDEQGAVRFSVKDTGVGIEPELLDGLFDGSRSVRARNSGSKQAGTGLGLALCRRIVERHEGAIWAESAAGAGTTVHFSIPLKSPEESAPVREAQEPETMKVLLLLKNPVLADCAVRALRLDEIESRVSTNLQEFFAALPQWTPDVVVVSPSFAWQLNDAIETRIRKAGVAHILIFSQKEGFVEMSPPSHSEPLLGCLGGALPDGGSVLLVEDDEDYGAVVEFELTQAGYEVVTAFNGLDALELVGGQQPDAMILDLALPQLDGFGVLEQLAARGVVLPTIVLTSLDDDAVDGRLAELGAIGVFRKYELIEPRGTGDAARVKRILSPVLAANPGEVSSEAGALPGA